MISEGKKLSYITFLQSFAVLLVVLGHSFPLDRTTNELPYIFNQIHNVLYSFHMPLFFAIAGFLFIYSMEKKNSLVTFKEFIIKKSKRLMIPYFTIGTIAYCLKTFIFNQFAYRPAQPSLSFYIHSMLAPYNNPNLYLWFLPVIFAIFIISFFIIKKTNIKRLFFISFLILFIIKYLPLHFLKIVLYNLFYFILGALIYLHKDLLFKLFNNIIFLLLSILLFGILYINYSPHLILKVLIATLGIFVSFSIAIIFDSKNYKFLYGIIDGKYYQIYLLSWFAQTGLRIFYQINLINYITTATIMFFGSIVFSLIVSKIIEKYMPKLKVFIGM